MVKAPHPELAKLFYAEVLGTTDSIADTPYLFYMLGVILTGGWFAVTSDGDPELRLVEALPSGHLWLLWMDDTAYSEDELKVRTIAVALGSKPDRST